jgi:hypothetical protein
MRYFVSLLIVLHLWAVVAEPLRFSSRGPGGSSPALNALYVPLRPYIEFCYLNHGYAFFAPDPGPSHVMQAELVLPEGRRVERRYPDLQVHQPRLLYHRYFMLSEFYNNLFRPPMLPPPLRELPERDPLRGQYVAERQMYERVGRSFRRAIIAQSGASEVNLTRLEHRLPGVDEVLYGRVRLDAPALYLALPEAPEELP